MIKKRIFIDLDGVLYAWNKGCCKLLGLSDFKLRIKQAFAEDTYRMETFFPEIEEKIANKGISFWKNLELFEWAYPLVDLVKTFNTDIAFLTSYGKWIDGSKGKFLACQRDKFDIPLIFGKQKWYLANKDSFLIDDNSRNINKFNEYGGHTYKWPVEYSFELGLKEWQSELKFLENKLVQFVNPNRVSIF